MKGDFSTWTYDPHDNDQGVLFQQGRVISDADLTAAERIALAWRTRAGRDIIGEGVASVPASEPGGFEIRTAKVIGGDVHLGVGSGRIWADGVLLYLPPDPSDPTADIDRVAVYYDPPTSAEAADPATIGDDDRDAVILEVALEALNGFQDHERLVEPALGGPDTAERITARHEFRLVRLGPGETCHTIRDRLVDGPDGKGTLTVSLEPPTVTPGDCPVVEGGGYTGFEHNLYRVEIAHVSSGGPRFKWSQWNGGLVGRGRFHAGPPRRVEITANRTAIVTSGLTDFYLEAIEYDPAIGSRRVVYGTTASLNSDEELELADPPVFGSFPASGGPVFFRLWNGIRDVDDFTDAADPEELQDGIHFAFDAPAADATYRPGDYWTFTVRAGDIANEQTLIDGAPPEGLELIRVPLAEIHWTNDQDTTQSGTIHDCRRRFRPLTNQKHCCTWQVGDGFTSFGDFNSVEEALAHLPPHGGEICLLPGLHFTNVVLTGKRNIRIRGCAQRTLVLPRLAKATDPIFQLIDCTNIAVRSMDLFAPFGIAVAARGQADARVDRIRVEDCRILARTYGVHVEHGQRTTIARNRIWLLDLGAGQVAISLRTVDALVERNILGVWPVDLKPPRDDDDDDGGGDADDPCADPDDLYENLDHVLVHVDFIFATLVTAPPPQPYRALGGIHLRGGCEDVRILRNAIDGGAGHGITLGGLLPGDAEPDPPADGGPVVTQVTIRGVEFLGFVQDESGTALVDIDLYLSNSGSIVARATSRANGFFGTKAPEGTHELTVEPGYEIVDVKESEFEGSQFFYVILRAADVEVPVDASFLYRIEIESNEIERMALSGIGFLRHTRGRPASVLPSPESPEAVASLVAALLAPRNLVRSTNVVVDLVIRDNRIHDNLRAVFDDALRRSAKTVGQGGISLAMAESVAIHGNHVHDNGTSAVDPCCGIFVGYGEDVSIADNHIFGNGPLTDEYDADRVDGIRGGIFVRFASALLLGATADALQKPALRVSDNRVDQPAGRALTAAAFGPVSVVGNYLNSEREGQWSAIDRIIGTVAIANVGGIHRQTRFGKFTKGAATGEILDLTNGDGAGGSAGDAIRTNLGGIRMVEGRRGLFRDRVRAELFLPGGETLFNSNQVRMGPRHRAIVSQLVLALDDIGFDGNQSSVFRPDVLLGNVVCVGHSLRATDNRFREQTRRCFFSAVTYGYGLTSVARSTTMNTTASNQGDHCIFALSNAPASGPPVLDVHNLEVNREFCRRIGAEPGTTKKYLWDAFQRVMAFQQAFTLGALEQTSVLTLSQSLDSIRNFQATYQLSGQLESKRLATVYGADAPRVAMRREQIRGGAKALDELDLTSELIGIKEIVQPDGGIVFDGRVNDEANRGRPAHVVELIRADGSTLGISAKTDRTGYFAVALDSQQAEALAGEAEVILRVLDAQGNEVHRGETPLVVEPKSDIRTRITIARRPPPTPDRRDEPARTSTPLERVNGIGPRLAEKMQAAGIPDIETLLRTPVEKLAEIGGFNIRAILRAAKQALRDARRDDPSG